MNIPPLRCCVSVRCSCLPATAPCLRLTVAHWPIASGAPSLRHAQLLVDCEISFGDVHAAGFRITASSLPYRIGDTLQPQLAREQLTTLDRAADGARLVRRWEIIAAEGELGTLAGSCNAH